MVFKDNFSSCLNNECIPVFKQQKVPVFQNKVYNTQKESLEADTGSVELAQSLQSGFIFNKVFNPDIMEYDTNYQNEQSNSIIFQKHLDNVLELLSSFGITDKRIVEVGCGKAIFFEKMLEQGLDCWGFDPTYEGNSNRIAKEYFSEKYKDINADVFIMRHTLEHIQHPFSFLHTIAYANNYKGYIFIEVPTFDWIIKKRAFWDIFYEHCNYFTEASLQVMFDEATTGSFFGGQYIYLWADLAKLRKLIPKQNPTQLNFNELEDKVYEYKDFLMRHQSLAIWGAGAKGSTFLNLLDANKKYIKYVIDINSAKQDKFIACTGHQIHSPDILHTDLVKNILVMNENYLDEIKEFLTDYNIDVYSL